MALNTTKAFGMRQFCKLLLKIVRALFLLIVLLNTLIPLLIHLLLCGFTLYLFISTWIKQDLTVALILSGFMILVIHPLVLAFFPLPSTEQTSQRK